MFDITGKMHVFLNKRILFLFFVSCFITNGFAQQPALSEDSIVKKFYEINKQQLYWFSSVENIKRANDWLTVIESADNFGLVTNKLLINQIRTTFFKMDTIDRIYIEKTDMKITAMVLNYIKYMQQGNLTFDYDEVSIPRDSVYINQLLYSKDKGPVSEIVSWLDCKDPDYVVLKKYLNDSITVKDTLKYKAVVLAMNYRRYLSANHQSEYIVVNIPAAEAEYYRNDSLKLKMRTVVGKIKTQTPVIASYITSIVTFPSWNVPYSIAAKEILPKIQKNDNYLEQQNIEVVDAKGNAIDESELNWNNYNEKNFPYYFRQSTGAGNALGVLKFNMQNPFSIFLHATSWQGVFAKDIRFLSHGCIRLEKPFELADFILRGKLDVDELKNGKKNTESHIIELNQKIPVFIIYMPVKVIGRNVVFLQDIYNLIK